MIYKERTLSDREAAELLEQSAGLSCEEGNGPSQGRELSTKSREQLLDALGRCYVEAALADLLSELERKHIDLQLVSDSEGDTSAAAHQTDRAHEAA